MGDDVVWCRVELVVVVETIVGTAPPDWSSVWVKWRCCCLGCLDGAEGDELFGRWTAIINEGLVNILKCSTLPLLKMGT